MRLNKTKRRMAPPDANLDETPKRALTAQEEGERQAFERQITEKLNQENATTVSGLLEKMTQEGKLSDSEALNGLQILITELDKIEEQLARKEIDEEGAKAAKKTLLESFADYKIDSIDLEKLELLRKHAEERLKLREALTQPEAPIFLRRMNDKRRIRNEDVQAVEFQVGKEYRIDFGYGDLTREQAHQAEFQFRLDEMLTDKTVTEVTLKREKGEKIVKLVRGSDNRFRVQGFPETAKHFFVWDGDIVTITKRKSEEPQALAAEAGPTTSGPAALEALPPAEDLYAKEAGKRFAVYEDLKAQNRQEYIERAQKELVWGHDRKVPEALKHWQDEEYAKKLYDLDYGEEILGALKDLARIAGQPTETLMWSEIRKKEIFGKADMIRCNEVTWAVFRKQPDTVRQRYQTIKRLLEEGGISEKRRQKLEEDKKELEDFFVATMILMDCIPNLKPRSYELPSRAEEAPELSGDLKTLNDACDLLFQKENRGPLIKRTLLQKLFAPSKSPEAITMQLHKGKVEYEDFMQKYMSDQAAWIYLNQRAFTYDPDTGRPEITEESKGAFVKLLNELRERGAASVSAEETLSEQVHEKTFEALTWENLMEALNSTTKPGKLNRELIRRGMAVELGEEFVREKQEEKESFAEKTGNPVEAEALKVLTELTKELPPEKLTEVAESLHSYYLGTAGAIFNQIEGGKLEWGPALDANVPLTKDGSVTMHVGFKDNVITHDFEVHAGAGVQAEMGRFELRFQAGAQVSVPEAKASVGAGTQLGYALDKYHAWTIHVGGGAGLTPESMASAFVLSIGVDRDLMGVLQKKTEKLREKQAVYLEEGLNRYQRLFSSSISENQKKAFEEQMNQMLLQELGEQAQEKLKKVQFLGAGLAVIPISLTPPLGIPIPYIKVGIKGKTFVVYQKPEDSPDLAQVEEARLRKAIAAQTRLGREDTVVEVYKSGYSLRTENGEKTISAAELRKEDWTQKEVVEEKIGKLEEHGIHLEHLEDGKVRLEVYLKAEGSVDIYTDPRSEIKTSMTPDGTIILENVGDLSVRRVDQYFPFEHFGRMHRTQIFLSNNIWVANEVIRGESHEHLHFTEYEGKRTKAEVVIDQREEILLPFDSQQALIQYFASMLPQEREARKAVREDMERFLKRSEVEPELTPDKKKKIHEMAQSMLDNKETRLSYKQLSVDLKYEDINTLIKEVYPGDTWTPHSLTYMHQALLVASLKQISRDKEGVPKLSEFMIQWNQKTLKKVLVEERHMDPAQADRIVNKVIPAIVRSKEFKAISRGSIVQIQIHSENIQGYRETFWDPDTTDRLFGPIPLQKEALTAIGLSEEDAEAFVSAMMERLSPLPEDKPYEFMHSQLGLALLDSADIVFPPAEGEKLVQLATIVSAQKNMTKDSNILNNYRDIYEKFVTIVKSLRENGKWEQGKMILSTLDRNVGFYEKCMNFTASLNEQLNISFKEETIRILGPQVVSTESRDVLIGRKHVKFVGGGVAAAYAKEKKAEAPPKEEVPEGEKEPSVTGGIGKPPEEGFGAGGGTDEDAGEAGTQW